MLNIPREVMGILFLADAYCFVPFNVKKKENEITKRE